MGTQPNAAEDLVERIVACASCHGERGQSRNETYYPSIAGKPAGYLFSQLRNFRDGRRYHEVMSPMLTTLADSYLREIADYYARQQSVWVPPDLAISAAQEERGRLLVERGDPHLDVPACATCHDSSLQGVDPWVPGLLGLRPEYLSAQLGAWRTAARRAEPPDCMATVAQRLSDDDISAVAAWLARQHVDGVSIAAAPNQEPMPCGTAQRIRTGRTHDFE